MKRRELILRGLGGLTIALQSYLGSSLTLTATASEPIIIPLEDEPLFRFIAAGDVGTGERSQYAVAQSMAQRWQAFPFPLALLTGDNIYEWGDIERVKEVFEQPYADLLQRGVTFRAVLGNHDFRANQGEDQIAYPGYNMPSRYYTFTEQTVQFFALDTNQAYIPTRHRASAWDIQRRWLERALKDSRAPWKIVFAHHPIYSSGPHGSDHDLVRTLSPLFAEYGVQIYINGHDHNYERTKSINGTTYITSGNGAKLRRVGRSRWTAHARSQLGFAAFDVHSDRIVVKAIDTNNRVYDEAHIMSA